MTNSRFQNPRAYFGVPLYSATLTFTLTGTSTPQATYSDSALTTPNTNPVVADSSGNFSEIFLTAGVAYKVVLKDQTGATIWTADPVEGGTSFSITGSNQFTTINNILYHEINPELITATSYTVLNADWGALKYFNNASAITVTLPSPSASTFINGWYCYIKNNGSSTLTINATATIDGAASLTLQAGNACLIVSNGTLYYTNSNNIPIAANSVWANITGSTATPTGIGFQSFINSANIAKSQVITATGTSTFTTASYVDANTRFKIILVGAGGSGSAINPANNCGGAGGGAAIVYVTGLAASTAYSYTVGVGGAAVTAAEGNAGGNTTITIGATTYTAGGGGGGSSISTNGRAVGGTTTNATIGINGQSTETNSGSSVYRSSSGGSSGLGGGGGAGRAFNANANGGDGSSGGGGGGAGYGGGTSGAGGNGFIIIEWN